MGTQGFAHPTSVLYLIKPAYLLNAAINCSYAHLGKTLGRFPAVGQKFILLEDALKAYPLVALATKVAAIRTLA
jgi:hypothetical protein